MPEKKKQHYVPKFYLRQFSNENKKFYLFNIGKKENIGPVPFETQCFEDYFYGADAKWENKLANLESQWNAALEHIKSHSYSENDIQKIKEFAMYQYIRTKKSLEKQTSSTQKTIAEILESYTAHKSLEASNLNQIIQEVSMENAKKTISAPFLLEMIKEQANLIDDLVFSLITFKTKTKLLSSDNPIIIANPYAKTAGLAMIGLMVIFPISPENLIIFYDGKIYGETSEKIREETINVDYYAQKINALAFANANKIIFSKDEITSDCFTGNYQRIREENETRESVSALGSNDNKIIAMRNLALKTASPLPFLKIKKDFFDIDPDCRVEMPRIYDEESREKAKRYFTVIPQIESYQKMLKYSQNEIERRKEQSILYYNLLLKYWGRKEDY